VRDSAGETPKEIGIQIRWDGTGVDEKGYWTESSPRLEGQQASVETTPLKLKT